MGLSHRLPGVPLDWLVAIRVVAVMTMSVVVVALIVALVYVAGVLHAVADRRADESTLGVMGDERAGGCADQGAAQPVVLVIGERIAGRQDQSEAEDGSSDLFLHWETSLPPL